MRISQWAHFDLTSEQLPATAITGLIGIEPDELMVRGSRRASPPVPVLHRWSLVCRQTGRTLDEQAESLLARIRPAQDRVTELVRSTDVEASLVFVRDFDDDEGEDESFEPMITPDGELEHLGGQHQLLGWILRADSLALLAAMDAYICADEYG